MNKSAKLAVIILKMTGTHVLTVKQSDLKLALAEYLGQPREVRGFDFVDWLRSSNKEIIGFRAHLYDEAAKRIASVKFPGNVTIMESGAIEVLFGNERAYDPSLSGDQAILDNALYEGNGHFAFVAAGLVDLVR